MNCPKCGHPNEAESLFCGECGETLRASDKQKDDFYKLLKIIRGLVLSGGVGLMNGWAISLLMVFLIRGLIGLLKIFTGETPPRLVDLTTFPAEAGNLYAMGFVFGGLFAAVVFPVFYFSYLKKIPFWRMWFVAFPTTLVTTTLGFAAGDFLGGYIGGIAGLVLTVLIFKLKSGGLNRA